MPEISYALRIAVINDVIKHARSVGAYHTYEWLESHLRFLETQNNERSGNEDSGSS